MTKSEIAKIIMQLKSALIFCHARPDGDTLSSAFSLKMALKKIGIMSEVTCPDVIPEKYNDCGLFDGLVKASLDYDAFISVDCASENMIGSNYDIYKKGKLTISIDHHISNTKFAKYNYVCDECANAINVYDIIEEMNIEIDEKMASCLYLGICTDSGNFSQANTDEKALKTASILVSHGAIPNKIYNSMFRNQSVERSKLYAKVMSGIKLFFDNKLAIITIRKKDLDSFNLPQSTTEGFIDFPLTIGSVEVAVSVLEKDDKQFKISFRSKNYVDVNALASVFGGGGHVRASGALICGFYEDVIDKITFNVGNYLE